MRKPWKSFALACALLLGACSDSAFEPSDADGDGFPLGFGDCDDNSLDVHPGRDEVPYDGVDQDCSGSDLVDVDRDGVVSNAAGGADCDDTRPDVKPSGVDVCGDGTDQDCSGADQACGALDSDGDGASPNAGDCNDTNAAIHPGTDEIAYNGVDDDCDTETRDEDLDGDGFAHSIDCDDEDDSRFPGANEVAYDGVDQNCDAMDLEDVDRDGVAALAVGGADCDDTRPDVKPTGVELCGDGIDQDCQGGDLLCGAVDADGDGFSSDEGDCNDADPEINPDESETAYNGVDDDCRALTRDDDLDLDGFAHSVDCDDDDIVRFPGANEVPYDEIDQDCSGSDLTDVDRDGYPRGASSAGDCDDLDAAVHPGAFEIPFNAHDEDCDGADRVTGTPLVLPTESYVLGLAYGHGTYFLLYSRLGVPFGQLIHEDGSLDGEPISLPGSVFPYFAGPVADATGFSVAYRTDALSPGLVHIAPNGDVEPVTLDGAVDLSHVLAITAAGDNIALAWIAGADQEAACGGSYGFGFLAKVAELDAATHTLTRSVLTSPPSCYPFEPPTRLSVEYDGDALYVLDDTNGTSVGFVSFDAAGSASARTSVPDGTTMSRRPTGGVWAGTSSRIFRVTPFGVPPVDGFTFTAVEHPVQGRTILSIGEEEVFLWAEAFYSPYSNAVVRRSFAGDGSPVGPQVVPVRPVFADDLGAESFVAASAGSSALVITRVAGAYRYTLIGPVEP